MGTIGKIWNESRYPEDALMAYMRLFCNDDYPTLRSLLFDYAQRCVTFDFKAVRSKVTNQYDTYTTSLLDAGEGWHRELFQLSGTHRVQCCAADRTVRRHKSNGSRGGTARGKCAIGRRSGHTD